jgi:hypothetical protein
MPIENDPEVVGELSKAELNAAIRRLIHDLGHIISGILSLNHYLGSSKEGRDRGDVLQHQKLAIQSAQRELVRFRLVTGTFHASFHFVDIERLVRLALPSGELKDGQRRVAIGVLRDTFLDVPATLGDPNMLHILLTALIDFALSAATHSISISAAVFEDDSSIALRIEILSPNVRWVNVVSRLMEIRAASDSHDHLNTGGLSRILEIHGARVGWSGTSAAARIVLHLPVRKEFGRPGL